MPEKARGYGVRTLLLVRELIGLPLWADLWLAVLVTVILYAIIRESLWTGESGGRLPVGLLWVAYENSVNHTTATGFYGGPGGTGIDQRPDCG
jgi:hypothetical protein